jgi:ketosteroid isomerase-like protein
MQAAMTAFSATSSAAELLDLVEAFDIEAAVQRFAPAGVLDLPNRGGGLPTELVGHAEIRRFMRALPKLFARLTFVDRHYHQTTTPTRAIVEYRGDGSTIAGRPYCNRYIAVFEFDESGALVLWREYFDPLVIQEALAPDPA